MFEKPRKPTKAVKMNLHRLSEEALLHNLEDKIRKPSKVQRKLLCEQFFSETDAYLKVEGQQKRFKPLKIPALFSPYCRT